MSMTRRGVPGRFGIRGGVADWAGDIADKLLAEDEAHGKEGKG